MNIVKYKHLISGIVYNVPICKNPTGMTGQLKKRGTKIYFVNKSTKPTLKMADDFYLSKNCVRIGTRKNRHPRRLKRGLTI